MITKLDRPPILRGALLAGVVGLVAGLLGRTVATDSSLVYLLVIVILGGMGVGGYVAGRDQRDTALSAGGISALLASAVLQILNVAFAAVRGTLSFNSAITVVFIVLVCGSVGVIGGYVAFRVTGRAATSGDATTATSGPNGGSPS